MKDDQKELSSTEELRYSSGLFKTVFKIERMNIKRVKRNETEEGMNESVSFKNLTPTFSGENSSDPKTVKNGTSNEQSLRTESSSIKKRNAKMEQKLKENVYDEEKEEPIDDIANCSSTKRKKHKTTEYFYLLERKALRMMRRYYKEAFELYANKYKYKQNLKRISRSLADQYFREYVDIEFERNKDTLKSIGKENMVTALQTIILCDRYNKNEQVTEGLDFDQIRNLLNKYNSKNLKDFFKNTSHAFLFSHYHRLRSEVDVRDQGHVDQEKLGKQMESLFTKSLTALPESIKATVTRNTY
jgi:hypothetical protein